MNTSESTQQPAPQTELAAQPASSILDTLRTLLAQELFLQPEEIDDETPFIELGLDSITGVNWVSNINARFGTQIEATKVYSHPTLAQIGRLVQEEATDMKAPESTQQPTLQTAPAPLAGASLETGPLAESTGQAAQPASSTLDTLRTLLAQELFLQPEEIDDETPFIELGLDSITGVNWVSRINAHFGTQIEATKVYSHPTLAQISRLVPEEAGILSEPAVVAQTAPQTANPQPAGQNSVLVSWRRKAPVQPSAPSAELSPEAAQPMGASAQSGETISASRQPIAVIGIAGQFPKAGDLDEFWLNLAESRDCISEISAERWSLDDYYVEGAPQVGKTNCKWSGLLENYDRFDPLFFNISPTEAECIDPQQRLFLQSCWHSIENAGYNPRSLSDTHCGVFVGCVTNDYQWSSPDQQLSAQGFMGGASSILAARISYFLNLRGPSIAIETACSSSLVAIANACDSLNAGNCDTALAGGVYVMGGPTMHIMTSQAGMLSSDGRCHTFDQRANGFVPGEGVGVVMLKRLADAERDGDRIQGVIEGWGLNQDGKSNGITAPNETAQSQLLQSIYRKFSIDPATIQLIEAHGTGTKLGDPIEVAGLKTAFGASPERSGYCALGSVKSNIGHCMTAAGVAGFIKLILALKHQALPPTIHYEQCNEHIRLDGSPFYINDQLRPWEPSPGQRRRAAISSFGFSGTNAHIVLSEYQEKPSFAREISTVTESGKLIVPLSARTTQQLRQKAQDLLAYIRQHEASLDLVALAYTLQVGREPMEVRLGLLVDSLAALSAKLEAYLAGERDIEDLHQGQVTEHREELKLIAQDQEMEHMIVRKWLGLRNLTKLLALWVKGGNVDWALFYDGAKPRPVELPVYPFAMERYWVSKPATHLKDAVSPSVGRLHPMLHRNTSNLWGQRFSSTFDGDEYFISDHVVGGRKILPGVAYLELARAAIEFSEGAEAGSGLRIEDVMWLRPLAMGAAALQAHVALYPEDDGSIGFEIYENAEGENSDRLINSQGQAVIQDQGAQPTLDLAAIAGRCHERELSAEAFYGAVRDGGLVHYGPAYRGVEHIAIGQDASGLPQVLASLALPPCVASTQGAHLLHPSFMDAAVQAVGVLAQKAGSGKIAVPFAVDEMRIWSGTPERGRAWARYSAGSSPENAVGRFDIDLCDESGKVCVRLTGLALRILENESESEPQGRTSLLQPQWRVQETTDSQTPGYGSRWLVLCDSMLRQGAEFEAALPGIRCLKLESDDEAPARRYQSAVTQMIAALRELMQEKPSEPVLIQVVTESGDEHALFEGLSGVLRTAQLENPKLWGQMISLEPGEQTADRLTKLAACAQAPQDREIRYQAGQRLVLGWEEMPTAAAQQSAAQTLWRDGGVYLITGGAGGLGLILAREIAQRVKTPVLVLTGRSELNESQRVSLEALKEQGAQVDYQRVDVTDVSALSKLVADLRAVHGGLHGVLHAAGVIHDALLLNKTPQEIQTVLAPKVLGVEALDKATRGVDLDFLLLFASTAGALGNVGQADYAAGNAFMDAYAAWRNARLARGERRGRTLSIGWPLWQDGGMRVDEGTLRALRAEQMVPLATEAGLQALYDAWASGQERVLVSSGDVKRLLANLSAGVAKPVKAKTETVSTSAVPQGELLERVRSMLIQSVSKQSKIAAGQIDPEKELSEYGFDSIMFTEFVRDLNQRYGFDLRPTIVFEYPTLSGMAQHLSETHGELLAQQFASSGVTSAASGSSQVRTVEPPKERASTALTRKRQPSRGRLPIQRRAMQDSEEGIAVIGMSGRFPMASDIDAFWRNLAEGRHCISEIPKARWDWREFYGDPLKEPGKTNIKYGGFIDGVDEFDPLFFGISPLEAEGMDPQQRLLMAHVWKALEDAGHTMADLAGSNTPIFAGMSSSEYSLIQGKAGVAMSGYSMTGLVSSVGPNRLSYLFDLHGPSEPVETACSSSLVAIHRAMQVLSEGDCEVAIAGGVNTLLTPEGFVGFSSAGMLSEDGRCKTFSKDANGYVRGEGVGVLVLKPLSAAQAAGDHIYGVIRGSAENHGGRAQSLTAPNPKAQAEVLKAAYRKAGVDPHTVTYIEAHGTGTRLGDPVEINALKQAFATLSQEGAPLASGYCGVGSVKTNIGHLELAAGVAGVIKVLLQMRHKTLVKSLHSEEINPYIQLEGSPFYVVQESRPWEALKDSAGRELPRRAGVSSFGFGGVNAHVVIEEHIEPAREPVSASPALVVLSAKNETRLRERIEQLLDAIVSRPLEDADLADMAYTLQVGREAMTLRLALLANSMEEVRSKLAAYLAGEDGIDEFYLGEVKKEKSTIDLLSMDEDMAQTLDAWLVKGKYAKLLELWVKGLSIDWSRLYQAFKPRRISLPSYPFAKERYWVKGRVDDATRTTLPGVGQLHPLLHQNTSNLWGQRFSSIFSGDEFFLSDHVVGGQRVLPGAAYLELARAAVERSAVPDTVVGLRLKGVVWQRPLIVDEVALEVHISLYSEDDGTIGFEIYDGAEDESNEPLIHCQGRVVLADAVERPIADLAAIQGYCHEREVEGEMLYELFQKRGLNYGPAFRGLERLHIGTGASGYPEVLGRLRLPQCAVGTQEDYVLHPSLVDAALQAVVGLNLEEGSDRTYVPFAVEGVQIWEETSEHGWAWVRHSEGSSPGERVSRFDIDLCNESGHVCAQLTGFAVRTLEGEPGSEVALFHPQWRNQAAEGEIPPYASRWVMLCDPLQRHGTEIEAALPGIHCVRLESDEEDPADRYKAAVMKMIDVLRNLMQGGGKEPVLIQLVTSAGDMNGLFEGLSGVLRTAQLENSKLRGQVIRLAGEESTVELLAKLEESARAPQDRDVRYPANERRVLGWEEIPATGAGPLWRDGGVYLITGGAGGLGLIFAREITRRVKEPVLVLTGRSVLNETRQASLDTLREQGARVDYRRVDVTDASAVSVLVADLVDAHGGLDGVLHCAGVIRDSLLVNKSREDASAVLDPKVAGVVALDEATRDVDLTFLVLFASASGALGNVGQADYAAGNAFLDVFASWRNERATRGERRGRTLSIDWPLWRDGGMQLDEGVERALRVQGVDPLESEAGIQAFYEAWSSGAEQVLVVSGDVERLRTSLLSGSDKLPELNREATPVPMSGNTQDGLLEKVQGALIEAVSKQLKVQSSDIDLDSELTEYGFDSISFTQFSHELNQRYGLELLPTVGFEHPTLDSLAHYLAQTHADTLAVHFAPSDTATVDAGKHADTVTPWAGRNARRQRGMREPLVYAKDARDADPSGADQEAVHTSAIAEAMERRSTWFPLRRPNQAAKMKLFCFPYAVAGGASTFYRWQDLLSDEVEVCPIQLPGRESRINEASFDNLDHCVDVLSEVLDHELDRPYALYGHSAGGLIAYKLAYKLNQTHERRPHHLFVGAYPSPIIQPNPIVERMRQRFVDSGFDVASKSLDLLNLSEIEQSNYIDRMTAALAPLHIKGELGKALLPGLIADTDLMQSYSWCGEQFDLPVTVFHGTADEVVTEEEMQGWCSVTTGPFAHHPVAGDHLFIREEGAQRLVVDVIARHLFCEV